MSRSYYLFSFTLVPYKLSLSVLSLRRNDCSLGKVDILIMEGNYLYAMNKCFLLFLLLSCGKDEAFAIQGQLQFKHTNGLFESNNNVRLQVNSYFLEYYQESICTAEERQAIHNDCMT